MKIIKEGDLSRIHTVRVFQCPDCGCIFEACGGEYSRTTIEGRRVCEHYCPTCNRLVRISDEETVICNP